MIGGEKSCQVKKVVKKITKITKLNLMRVAVDIAIKQFPLLILLTNFFQKDLVIVLNKIS